MSQPLTIKNKLAKTPKECPTYSVSVKLKSGKTLAVANPNATRAMVALMDMQAVMGGAASHYGGPAALAEAMSALHGFVFHRSKELEKEWYDCFHLINDAGHCENGLYALKANYNFADLSLETLKGFRSINSPLTGHGEAHIFPEAVYLSNGPLGSAVGQAQGLAQADAMSENKTRVTVLTLSDGAAMEGEAKEALTAIPGFAKIGKLNPFILILSDNNTKLSGRIDEQSYSMQPSFESMERLGWKRFYIEDGHNLQTVLSTLEEAYEFVTKNPQQPVFLHIKTIKGYGVNSTMLSQSGGHGFPLKDPQNLLDFLNEIYQPMSLPLELRQWADELLDNFNAQKTLNEKKSKQKTEKVQVGVSEALVRLKKQGMPIVSITSDLPGSTGVADFHKQFPDAVVDVGIAESNMISVAAGFSKQGYIPVVDTFAQFGVTKGALPFIMSSLSEAPMIAIFSHAGFQDAADGASHQALSYISMTSSIPYLDTYILSCSQEADELVSQAIEEFYNQRVNGQTPRSKVFFLGRENFESNYKSKVTYRLGKSQVVYSQLEKERNLTILSSGPLVHKSLSAAEELKKVKIGVEVINASTISQPDVETLRLSLEKTSGHLLTIEDHQLTGGLGSLYTHALLQNGVKIQSLKSMGVKGLFGQSAYKADELYAKHGLDVDSIVINVKDMFAL